MILSAGRRAKVYAELMGVDEHAAAGPPGSARHWQPLTDVKAAGKFAFRASIIDEFPPPKSLP